MQQLAQDLLDRALRAPDEIAVIDGTGSHTIGEVVAAAQELTGLLAGALRGHPTVLVQADNSWRTLAASIAVGLRGGLIAVISRHATASEYDFAVRDLMPDAVVAAAGTCDSWGVSMGELALVGTGLDGWSVHASASGSARGVERWKGGTVVAMTSGSTGRPKCVVQSEEALRYAGQATIDAVGLKPGDAIAALVPLSSVAAVCFGMHLPAMLGAPMVCLDKWSPEGALRLMHEHRVRWTMLVPTMALQLSLVPGSEGQLESLRAMTVGGGPMNEGVLQRAESHLGTRFLRVFGMSECLGHTTPRPDDEPQIRLGRDGRPFPGTVVRIVDDEGRGVAPGVIGQAQVRGPSLFVGYAREGRAQGPDLTPDGFLATGDLARVNEDGTLNILGREKQVIIRGGRNIDINEVEAAMAALPGVAQVCVVPVPDEMLGERAAALIVPVGEAPTLEDVRRQLEAADFPKFKWPEFVVAVSDLPQNRVGKLNRRAALELAAAKTAQSRAAM